MSFPRFDLIRVRECNIYTNEQKHPLNYRYDTLFFLKEDKNTVDWSADTEAQTLTHLFIYLHIY